MLSRQKSSNPVHEISSRSFRKNTNRSEAAEPCDDSSRMDLIVCITLELRWITGLYLKEVSLQVESEFDREDKLLPHNSGSHERRTNRGQIEMETNARRSKLV